MTSVVDYGAVIALVMWGSIAILCAIILPPAAIAGYTYLREFGWRALLNTSRQRLPGPVRLERTLVEQAASETLEHWKSLWPHVWPGLLQAELRAIGPPVVHVAGCDRFSIRFGGHAVYGLRVHSDRGGQWWVETRRQDLFFYYAVPPLLLGFVFGLVTGRAITVALAAFGLAVAWFGDPAGMGRLLALRTAAALTPEPHSAEHQEGRFRYTRKPR